MRVSSKKQEIAHVQRGSLMFQGTASDVGKTLIVTGLCRVLKRMGINVAPFKPQNMALNSAVTQEGGEIGRAQALQASACGLEPSVDFNPVLLKPSSNMTSQVIILGQAVNNLEAHSFGDIRAMAFEAVLETYQRLRQRYDVVLIEGAGSPAEVNLRANDIANMGFAEAVDCPVVLIGDINRGGVFAHLTGTLNLLSNSEQARTRGFIINQFRGDLSLLQSGLDWLVDITKKPLFGVLPFISALKLDAEDAIATTGCTTDAPEQTRVHIKIPVLPRISNHNDFDPLRWHPNIHLEFIGPNGDLSACDLIILPGTKSVRDDLAFLEAQGWREQIARHLRYNGKILGICGGYQILGQTIADPTGVEGTPGTSTGLGLLDIQTQLQPHKQLIRAAGTCTLNESDSTISGYEIHCGQSTGTGTKRPFAWISDNDTTNNNNNPRPDGAISSDNQVAGTYLHGLFESADVVRAVIKWATDKTITAQDWQAIREQEIERLADAVEEHLDIDALLQAIG